jgi:hypothetical protein
MLKDGINAAMTAIIDRYKGRFSDVITAVEFIMFSLPNVSEQERRE